MIHVAQVPTPSVAKSPLSLQVRVGQEIVFNYLMLENADACKVRAAACCGLRPLSFVFLMMMSPQHCQEAEYGQVETRTPELTLH